MKTNLDKTTFNINGEKIIGDALKMRETRLNQELKNGTITPDGEDELNKIREKLQDARNKINNGQDVTQDVDFRNTFQKEQGVTDVSKVNNKSSNSTTTSNSKVLPISALKEEIQKIKHLIEYHNNNNK
jgi:hypothetical protein